MISSFTPIIGPAARGLWSGIVGWEGKIRHKKRRDKKGIPGRVFLV
jgi:hypothetical protein